MTDNEQTTNQAAPEEPSSQEEQASKEKLTDEIFSELTVLANRFVDVVQQGVDQRAVRMTGAGVDHHARGLVHHDHVLVLVHDAQGQILGDGVDRRRRRQRDLHPRPDGHRRSRTVDDLPLHRDLAVLDQLGRTAAGHVGHQGRHDHVEPCVLGRQTSVVRHHPSALNRRM